MNDLSTAGMMAILATFVFSAMCSDANAETKKSKAKFSYEDCLTQKMNVGLPPARAARVCQSIMSRISQGKNK
jgi:hypothetical protein